MLFKKKDFIWRFVCSIIRHSFLYFTLTLAHVQLWQNHLVLSSASHRG